MATSRPDPAHPSRAAVDAVLRARYGDPTTAGWAVRMRHRFGHATPDEVYEAVVDGLITDETRWLDVGCGRNIFPSNPTLAATLAERCARLVGVDPDPTLDENPYVHERVASTIDQFRCDAPFDVVTLRMVAEHVEHPQRAVAALSACTRAGGHVVVYTPNRFSPVPLITAVLPFGLHQPIKRLLWRTEAKDTFPTCFRMNTRRRLRALFDAGGFDEAGFAYLDDCRSFARFPPLLLAELSLWRGLRALGCSYPENCLLGVYRRRPDPEPVS